MGRELGICIRYLTALILGLFLNIFYIILTPLTVYSVYFVLSLFYPVSVSGNSLIIQFFTINLIPACIAGSAYYLLVVLNLITPMKAETRAKALVFSIVSLFIINVLRISLFSALLLSSPVFFNLVHMFFWYVLSIVLVFLVWLAEIKIFKIKEIPGYTDIKHLYSLIKKKGKKRR